MATARRILGTIRISILNVSLVCRYVELNLTKIKYTVKADKLINDIFIAVL